MSNHSPQPWTCQQSYSGPEWQGNSDIFIHSGPFHVATVHRHRPEFQLDDAKLIKAAPIAALRTSNLAARRTGFREAGQPGQQRP